MTAGTAHRVLLRFAVPLSLLLIACGGSSTPKPLFDPNHATELAKAAMIKQGDLPGEWQIRDDDFSDDETVARLPACAATLAVQKAEAVGRSGRASRAFGRVIIGDAAYRITGLVEVYPTEAIAKAVLAKRKALEASDAGISCYQALIKEGTPTLAVKATRVPVLGATVSGGNSTALELEVGNSSQTVGIHLELHHWQRGNAVVSVVVSGGKDEITEGAVNAAVERQQESVEAAAAQKS